ncbi:hypothetical protein [Streptomyces niveus]|uniref:hypothetical protein n=1 Tax=Streptomyces niveus TaxID=193462 RepID=UPI00133185A2|nr:hypothetical protein [Streptomyces niveus]
MLTQIGKDPRIENIRIGEAIRFEVGASWEESTTDGVGGDFRSWVKAAGVEVKTARRRMRHNEDADSGLGESTQRQLAIGTSEDAKTA